MYTHTTIANPSHRAQTLSQELIALVRARRGHDPELGVPDALVALELSKAALLSESGVSIARRQALVIAATVLCLVAGALVFLAGQ